MKRIYKVLIFLVVFVISIGYLFFIETKYESSKNNIKTINAKIKKANIIVDINSKFSTYVKTNKESKIYKLENGNYIESGILSKDINLTLTEEKINENTKYFHIKDLDYYISYNDIEESENQQKDDRYKKYVVFNKNIVTKEKTTFYKSDTQYITLNKSYDLPIIIKDTDKYYVEFYNDLYYVKKQDVDKIKDHKNTDKETRNNIRTLTYHTIYDKKTQKCTNTVICHPIEQFESHMKYLHDNNYLTLTMKELEMFLDKKIQIPKKSIVITLDDGKYAKNAVNIVEKYNVNATYYIISGVHDVSKIKTTYMDFQSHTHNMHNNYKCPGGNQGGELLCADENKILEDLKKSKETLGGDVFAIAYPFFDFNDRAIKLLKKSGFRLAFIGQYNTDGYSTYTTDRFMLRRKTIFSSDSLNTFESYLK